MMMNILNVWDFPIDLFALLKRWLIFKKVSTSSAMMADIAAQKPPVRVDAIGRIYTVLNIQEEIRDDEKLHYPFIADRLGELDELLAKHMLSDIAYPEVTQIPGSWSYLIKITPYDGVPHWYDLIAWLFKMGLWAIVLRVLSFLLFKATGISASAIISGLL